MIVDERAKPKKFKFSFLGSNEERDEIRFGNGPESKAGGVYSFTNSTHEGIFKYSRKVYFNYVFVKPRSQKTSGVYVIGKLNNEIVFRKDVNFGGLNEWKRVYLDHRALIDEVVISRDTSIDSLDTKFNYTEFEENLTEEDIVKLTKPAKIGDKNAGKEESLEDIFANFLSSTNKNLASDPAIKNLLKNVDILETQKKLRNL